MHYLLKVCDSTAQQQFFTRLFVLIDGDDFKFSAGNFVAQNAGKLRDFYRIGKMLGSGKIVEKVIPAHTRTRVNASVSIRIILLNRCLRRSQNVCAS